MTDGTTFETTDLDKAIAHVDQEKHDAKQRKARIKKSDENRCEKSIHQHRSHESFGYSKKYSESSIWDVLGPSSRSELKSDIESKDSHPPEARKKEDTEVQD